MEIRRTGIESIQSPETVIPETAPEKIAQQTATESYQEPLSESTIAARKNELAMTGMLQQSLLNSQLTTTNRPAEPVPTTGEKAPGVGGSTATRELKPGDSGDDVRSFKFGLNDWRLKNNLPPIDTGDVYNEETKEAVLQFQRANNLTPTGKAGPAVQELLKLERNPEFQNLNGEVKDMIRQDFSILENDPVARQRLTTLATDKTFSHLIPMEAQKSAIGAFMSNTASPEHFKGVQDTIVDIAVIEKEKTIDHLPAETKQKVYDTLFTAFPNVENYGIGDAGFQRQQTIFLAKSTAFEGLTTQQQKDLLDGVAGGQHPSVPGSMQMIIETFAFQNASPAVRDRIAFLTSQNAKGEDAGLELGEMYDLMQDPKFITATEDEQNRMLNKFRKTYHGDEN